jgi:hypothetical protein
VKHFTNYRKRETFEELLEENSFFVWDVTGQLFHSKEKKLHIPETVGTIF